MTKTAAATSSPPSEAAATSRPAAQVQAPTAAAGACPSAAATSQTSPMPSPAATVCMDADEIERSLTRMAHQILEANKGARNLALVGIVTRGDLLAKKLAERIQQIEGAKVPLGKLDISFYRDDFATYLNPEIHSTQISFDIDGMTVVLVDDVLFTGRTIRAALDALMDIGRPACVQLAVLVDRGHRQLPIRADYVGKNVPSSENQSVRLFLEETDGRSAVEITELAPGQRAGASPLAQKGGE